MNPEGPQQPVTPQAPQPMPIGYRLFFWLMILDILLLTGFVWLDAMKAAAMLKAGMSVPADLLSRALLSYHFSLFVLTLIAYGLQQAWRAMGTMLMFPTAFVVCALELHVIAAQISTLA